MKSDDADAWRRGPVGVREQKGRFLRNDQEYPLGRTGGAVPLTPIVAGSEAKIILGVAKGLDGADLDERIAAVLEEGIRT